jgi:hypothetical protein
VFGVAGRRAAEILVGLFALLGFVCVPLGQKTGFEHLLAIASTPAVLEAAGDMLQAAQRVRTRLLGALATEAVTAPAPPSSVTPSPVVPRLGR